MVSVEAGRQALLHHPQSSLTYAVYDQSHTRLLQLNSDDVDTGARCISTYRQGR